MSLLSGTLSRFESLFLLLDAACLMKKHQIPILYVFGLTQPEPEPMIYCTQGKHTNHYTTDTVKTVR
jgi:hypothetical protein